VRINDLTYLTDPSDPTSLARVPDAFQIVAGPIGAGGLPDVTDHSFTNIKSLADNLAAAQAAVGMDPNGLNPDFPGLLNLFREGDPDADVVRQPVDFYSPDTFNYADLEVSADGTTLSVSIFGVNRFAANTFPEPGTVGPERLILSFQITNAPPAVEGVQINDGSAQRSKVNRLTVTFNRVVTIEAGAFELRREGGGLVDLGVTTSVVAGKTVAVLTFAGPEIIGGSLADGQYTLTIHSDHVHDRWGRELDGDGNGSAGGDRVDGFFRLFGDTDGDHDVDHTDLDVMLSSFRKNLGDDGFLWFLDYDGDGDGDGLDMAQFNQRRGS
jgi:hypothetical protein